MSNIPIILDGLYLSDNPDNLTKWQFPEIQLQLEPEDFLIVWCDEDGSQGPLHASFKLSASGEYVILTAANGVDILDIIEFGAQNMDVSLGRLPDGDGEWAFLPESSPGDYNDVFGCISGDLTCDDAIDVLDIVRMVSWILTGYDPDPWELLTADMNSDGSIDVLDVVILVDIILNV